VGSAGAGTNPPIHDSVRDLGSKLWGKVLIEQISVSGIWAKFKFGRDLQNPLLIGH
jgi:hypothetical protein